MLWKWLRKPSTEIYIKPIAEEGFLEAGWRFAESRWNHKKPPKEKSVEIIRRIFLFFLEMKKQSVPHESLLKNAKNYVRMKRSRNSFPNKKFILKNTLA